MRSGTCGADPVSSSTGWGGGGLHMLKPQSLASLPAPSAQRSSPSATQTFANPQERGREGGITSICASCSRISRLAAGARKNGENGKMAAKWGKMGGDWGEVGEMGETGNNEKLPKIHSRKCRKRCVKLVGNGRKIGVKWDNLGHIPHFTQSQFSHFSTALPPFPQDPLMNFASRTSRLEKWKFVTRRYSPASSADAVPWHQG